MMYYLLNVLIMNKKIFLAIAAFAMMAVSCSMNEIGETNVTTSDAISLSPGTTASTRAAVVKVDSLQKSGGFAVYATNSSSPSAWNTDIEGAIHKWNAGKWNFTPPVKWPEDDVANYPMTFYAFFPPTHDSIQVAATWPNLKLNVKVPQRWTRVLTYELDKQFDLIAGQNEALSKPASSTLSMPFKHALSKIHFTVSTKPDHKSYVLSVGLVNVNREGTFDVKFSGLDPKDAWSGITNPTGIYNYYNHFEEYLIGYNAKEFLPSVSKAPFYPAGWSQYLNEKNAFLMLIPQDQTSRMWKTSSKDMFTDTDGVDRYKLPEPTDTYIRMLYRTEITNPADAIFIGYDIAEKHPNYAGSNVQSHGYAGPLYVLVGYSYDGIWEPGKGYQYDIMVPGSTGGILLDQNYWDDHGHRTDLPVEHHKPGDPILSGDEYIHLVPIITDWVDTDGIVNNQ